MYEHQQIEFLLLAIISYYCDAIIANNSDKCVLYCDF